MKDWKIGLRIAAGFALVILTTIVLGSFALNRVNNIQKNSTEVSTNLVPNVLALYALESNLYHSTASLLQLVASSDPRLIHKLQDDIAALRADDDKQLKFYESTPFSDEEARIYAESKVTRVSFIAQFDEVMKEGQSTDPAEIAKAQLMFEQQLRPIYEKYLSEIQTEVEINHTEANSGMATIGDAVHSASYGIWIGMASCLLFAIPITIYIVRGITQPLSLAVEALKKVSDGDLTARMDVSSKDEIGQMAISLNEAVERLNSTMQEVAENAANASSSSQQLAAAAEAIASGAQEQAASLEETAASLEQITASVRQSADNAQQASQLATGSKDSALQGQEVVSKAITAMSEINASSAKIADIISTIDEIAFQTNLLAVNAAVEAARAGEEGRGFAVVASEVRSLAQRSALAAKEIKILIQDSLQKVNAGSGLVNRSGETLQGIVGSVKRVTDIVGEMAASATEQSTGIEQVNSAMTQMDQVTQSNSAQTEELSATAESLSEQASHLMDLVSTFTLSQGGKLERQRPAVQPHAPVALRLATRPSPVQHLKSAVRPLAKSVRTSLSVKSGLAARAIKRSKSLEPTRVMAVPSGTTDNDASFQEF